MALGNRDDALIAAACCCVMLSEEENRRKKRRFWVRPTLEARKKYIIESDSLEEFELGELRTDGSSRNFFRMTSQDFENLLQVTGLVLKRKLLRSEMPPQSKERSEVTLTGDSFASLAVLFRMSKSTISLIVPEVSDAMPCELIEGDKDVTLECLGNYARSPAERVAVIQIWNVILALKLLRAKRRERREYQHAEISSDYAGELGSIPGGVVPGSSHVCQTMPLVGGFSRGSSPPPAQLHSGTAPYSPHFTLSGSQDLAVKNRSSVSAPLQNTRFVLRSHFYRKVALRKACRRTVAGYRGATSKLAGGQPEGQRPTSDSVVGVMTSTLPFSHHGRSSHSPRSPNHKRATGSCVQDRRQVTTDQTHDDDSSDTELGLLPRPVLNVSSPDLKPCSGSTFLLIGYPSAICADHLTLNMRHRNGKQWKLLAILASSRRRSKRLSGQLCPQKTRLKSSDPSSWRLNFVELTRKSRARGRLSRAKLLRSNYNERFCVKRHLLREAVGTCDALAAGHDWTGNTSAWRGHFVLRGRALLRNRSAQPTLRPR
ncbi:hypothetical protein PR048_018562 [Dryococelus australis]|uniref:Uncharacterized protein n=1 Tax=Dryococelus australis TaxID=614101 RepID=A0ABQ9HCT2_9NEOP|nr:hypothetical protein PR048_018562 [Dryococelus australis]